MSPRRTFLPAVFTFLSCTLLLPAGAAAGDPPAPGSIAGTVIDRQTGQPYGGGCAIRARPWGEATSEGSFTGYCGQDGSFAINGVPPGSYQVLLTPYQPLHAPSLLGVGSCNLEHPYEELFCDPSAATRVEVAAGEVSGPYPIELDQAVWISGEVDLPDGTGILPIVRMRLFQADGREVAAKTATSSLNGFYNFGGLAPGSYRMMLDGNQWWENALWRNVECNRWYCDPLRGEPIEAAAGEEIEGIDFLARPLPFYPACTDSDTAICLQQGRFRVETTWTDFLGQTGPGRAVRVTDEAAYFWFFSPGNVELMVKALNGCDPDLGHHFWLFAAGLTNVEVEMTVTDTLTEESKTYRNTLGNVIAPVLDTGAFATCDEPEPGWAVLSSPPAPAAVPAPAAFAPVAIGAPQVAAATAGAGGTCVPNGVIQSICISGDRFEVSAKYGVGDGPLLSAFPLRLTGDTAAFHFFSGTNIEVLVKVLDACNEPHPGRWVFAAGLTDVAVEITVKDTATGESEVYRSGPGPFQPIFDLGTFAGSC